MVAKINPVLKKVLEGIKIPAENEKNIDGLLKSFVEALRANLKSLKIDADVFVGGSAAKGTMINSNNYDIDIFIRFGKKYEDADFSTLTRKVLSKMKGVKFEVIHGSRDYFQVKISDDLFFEVIPVKRVKNAGEANNITDLSYSHVNYVKKKVKGKVLDDVKLAKAFCHAKGCYGAESYIKGFSGYGLELLTHSYGSFEKLAKALAKVGEEKLVIDIEKFYKNKNVVLMDLNESKLGSPIVLVDPTCKTRNVLAALSDKTFRKFQKDLKSFLGNPRASDFERADMKAAFEKAEKNAARKKFDFVLLEARTEKQAGDVAGSKLLKFRNHLKKEIEKFFDVKDSGFDYAGENSARFFVAARAKKDLLVRGPRVDDKDHVKRFKARHKSTFVKSGRVFAREKVGFGLKEFLKNWMKKNSGRMKEMGISGVRSQH